VIFCGPVGSESPTPTLAVNVPVLSGVKMKPILQLELAATAPPAAGHVVVVGSRAQYGLVPAKFSLGGVSGVDPSLVNVDVFAVLELPGWMGRHSLDKLFSLVMLNLQKISCR
jgi:hypothetical protein